MPEPISREAGPSLSTIAFASRFGGRAFTELIGITFAVGEIGDIFQPQVAAAKAVVVVKARPKIAKKKLAVRLKGNLRAILNRVIFSSMLYQVALAGQAYRRFLNSK